MARRSSSLGSWNYGGAPAEGAASMAHQSDSEIASGFLKGIVNATKDPVTSLPGLEGSSIRGDVNPGVWGRCCQCP